MTNYKSEEVIPEFLIQMTNGLSNHIRTAPRLWLALAVISIATISFSGKTVDTTSQESISKTTVSLPFNIGEISKKQFYPFSASLLSILIISFGAAQSQSIRSRKLVNKALREMEKHIKLPGGCDLRDSIDVILVNSINRTVPLAQLLLGKYQFYPQKNKQPRLIKVIAVAYQIILKLLSYLVVYALPAYALYLSFHIGELFVTTNNLWGIPIFFLWFVAGIGSIILIQLFILEIIYAVTSICKIFSV